jgi:selenocysteine lyase/cysteine desulfurase
MQVPIKVVGGKLFVRIAVHVYNCIADYQRLVDAINEIRSRHS